MAVYFPPRVNVSTFNPINFIDIGSIDSTASNSATLDLLEAETDAITTAAAEQQVKFSEILTNPKINFSINLSGTFNVGATGVTLTLGDMEYSINYYYYATLYLNFIQSGANSGGTIFAIQDVQCFSNLTNSYSAYASEKTGNSAFGHPGFQATFLGQGFNQVPTFKFTFPEAGGGYTTNPNSFTAQGFINIIGITVSK